MSTLAASYELCRKLHALHGRTYYLAARLLPRRQRLAVHALYGFARYVDDIVDVPLDEAPDEARIDRIERMLLDGLTAGRSDHPVLAATIDTARRYGIEHALLTDFLVSMRMDLVPREYPTWEALRAYTWGSASVIGLQMTRVIGVVGDPEGADRSAAALGEAFQITNFCRDYDEDRRRGRVYLPTELFARVGASPGTDDRDAVREVIRAATGYARERYREAEPGIAQLHPDGRDCIATAYRLYSRILDEIEQADFDVLGVRHRVGTGTRLRVAAPALARVAAQRGSALLRRPRA